MRYIPCWKQIGISKDRYFELLHLCRQYSEWKREANTLLGIRAIKTDGRPAKYSRSDPVALAAERREGLMKKIRIVEECANTVENGKWSEAIIQNVCNGKPYAQIDMTLMPTTHRQDFFARRREFFAILNKRVG